MARVKRPAMQQVLLSDFGGGLNLLDAPTEVGPNETPYCLNVTLDERGGLQKRLGLQKLNAGAMAGTASSVYYSPSLQVTIIQIGAGLYKTSDWVTFTLIATLTSSAIMAFTDFQGKLIGVHIADGVYGYDGTTWSLLSAGTKGTCIAAWQNAVYVGGNPTTPSLVIRSSTGDASGWTIGVGGCASNQLREKDDTAVTALGIGQGQDISGRPGLLAFKEESTYRINDSGSLAYSTIDGSAGASGPRAVFTLGGVTAAFCKRGIFVTDAAGTTDLQDVTKKVAPMFRPDQMNFAKLDKVVAGGYRDRIVFSFPWGASQATNNRTLELHADLGWIVPHSFGSAGFTTYGKQDNRLFAASPSSAYVYDTFRGGSDDGAAITATYKTREILPAQGNLCTFRHLRLTGRGAFQLYTLLDYDQGQGELNDVSILGTAFTWNDPATALWNDPVMVWGPTQYEGPADFYSLGVAESISFVMQHTGLVAASGPRVLADGAVPEVGAFACYSMLLDYVQHGYA